MFGISIPSLRGKRLIESALLVTLILFGCLFLYLALGLPLAFVLGGVGMIGCLILWGPSGFMIASSQGYAAMGKFTLISMNNTKVVDKQGKFEKDKSSERKNSVMPEEATHFGDAVDKRIWTKYGGLLLKSSTFVSPRI